MDILLKRGTLAKVMAATLKEGEPAFAVDTQELFLGDGTTPGGAPIGTIKPSGVVAADMVALFKGATGKLLQGITKSDFLKEYPTGAQVTSEITTSVPSIKVNNALQADVAANATLLKGRGDYLNTDNLTSSYQEDSDDKVVRASSIKALWDSLTSTINVVKGVSDANTLHLSKLPGQVLKGMVVPLPTLGNDGDVYLQYN